MKIVMQELGNLKRSMQVVTNGFTALVCEAIQEKQTKDYQNQVTTTLISQVQLIKGVGLMLRIYLMEIV
ncbi:hypothetical protein Scep_009321 [Stephania cephalantha]|uniref:Uncharacterized protein n=1 Tax=Stephania cephalantha TaxID=152367 RepID=A0AAP0JTY0_9MAGN